MRHGHKCAELMKIKKIIRCVYLCYLVLPVTRLEQDVADFL
jgi:hypothetical protein